MSPPSGKQTSNPPSSSSSSVTSKGGVANSAGGAASTGNSSSSHQGGSKGSHHHQHHPPHSRAAGLMAPSSSSNNRNNNGPPQATNSNNSSKPNAWNKPLQAKPPVVVSPATPSTTTVGTASTAAASPAATVPPAVVTPPPGMNTSAPTNASPSSSTTTTNGPNSRPVTHSNKPKGNYSSTAHASSSPMAGQNPASSTKSSSTSTSNALALRERFLHLVLTAVGQKVVVTTVSGAQYAGIFHTTTVPFAASNGPTANPNEHTTNNNHHHPNANTASSSSLLWTDPSVRNKYVLKAVTLIRPPGPQADATERAAYERIQPGQTLVLDQKQVVDLHWKAMRLWDQPAGANTNNNNNHHGPNSSQTGADPTGPMFQTDSEISHGNHQPTPPHSQPGAGRRPGRFSGAGKALVEAGSAWTSGTGRDGALDGLGPEPLTSSSTGPSSASTSSLQSGLKGSIGAWDQFKANEELFQVTSSYDENLYTTALDKAALNAEQVRQAERLAREIESSVSSNMHLAEERNQVIQGDYDEEDRYSGVLTTTATPNASSQGPLRPRHAKDTARTAPSETATTTGTTAVAETASNMTTVPAAAKTATGPQLDSPNEAVVERHDAESKKPLTEPEEHHGTNDRVDPTSSGSKETAAAVVAATSRTSVEPIEEQQQQPLPSITINAQKSSTDVIGVAAADKSAEGVFGGTNESLPVLVEEEIVHPDPNAVNQSNYTEEASHEVDGSHEILKAQSDAGKEDAPQQKAASRLNANAREFTLNVNAKSFKPNFVVPSSSLPPPPPPPPLPPTVDQHQGQVHQMPPQAYANFEPGMPYPGAPLPHYIHSMGQPGMGIPMMNPQYSGMRFPHQGYPNMEMQHMAQAGMQPMPPPHQPHPTAGQHHALVSPVPADSDGTSEADMQPSQDGDSASQGQQQALHEQLMDANDQMPQPHSMPQQQIYQTQGMPYAMPGHAGYYPNGMPIQGMPQRPGMVPLPGAGYPAHHQGQFIPQHQMQMMRPPGGPMYQPMGPPVMPGTMMRPGVPGGMQYYGGGPVGPMPYPTGFVGYDDHDMSMMGGYRGGGRGGRGRGPRGGRGRNNGRGRPTGRFSHHYPPPGSNFYPQGAIPPGRHTPQTADGSSSDGYTDSGMTMTPAEAAHYGATGMGPGSASTPVESESLSQPASLPPPSSDAMTNHDE